MSKRLRNWVLAMSAIVFPLPALLIAVRAYRAEKALFFPRRAPIAMAAGNAGLPGIVSVEMGAPVVRGWYVPSRNGAAVILMHGSGADRTQMLPEARVLAAQGFGTLLFDWPGHGESEGEVHWQEGERRALTAALDWLSARTEVEGARIGALGFSMGGYTLAQVAARDPRVRAVALVGTPSDVAVQSRWQFGKFGPLTQLPARWALERGGLRLDETQPRAAVPALAPRPLLLISGAQDRTVPPFMADELFAAAGQPKELFVVPGADHGTYDHVAPAAYRQRITEFFGRTLGQGSGAGLAK